jgi:ribosomal-protein-alanine N-acetyltransferase
MRLELSRCIVRPWASTDAASLQRHANNRNVSRYLRDRFPFPYERQHADAFLTQLAEQAEPTAWAIEVDGEAVGGIGLEIRADIERVSAEIGYWLTERLWGRGIVTEVLTAVTEEAFKRFDLTRLYAVAFTDHAASIRVLEKAGYVREGRMRQSAIKDGTIRDQFLYAAYKHA